MTAERVGRGPTGPARVYAATGTALAVTLGAIALGGVPLAVGLLAAGACATAILPDSSRRYLARRALVGLTTVVVAMGVVWFLVHHLPASPPLVFEGDRSFPSANRSFIEMLRDDPTDVRVDFDPVGAMRNYGDWLGDLASWDLGDTQYSETVTEGVARTIPISMQLVLYSQLIAVLIAVPAALVGARSRGRLSDLAARCTALFGLSLPVFVIGPVLVFVFAVGEFELFGITFGYPILPSGRYTPLGESAWGHLRSMALPSFTLGLNTAAVYLVLLRSEMSQQLTLDHAQLAQAKGVPPAQILRRHALRPAAPTVVAAIAAHSAVILGHLLIIERIFLLPGFGDYVLIAIVRNDIPAIVGALFVSICILVVVNLLADAALLAVDPRLASAVTSRR